MRNLFLISALVCLAACSSLTPIDDPVYLRISDMEARLIRIEQVLNNQSLISLAGDISELRTEVQELLGQVETIRFDLDNQAEGNRSLYQDLDQRLQDLEAAQQQLRSLPLGGQVGGSGSAIGDQQAYDAAFALVSSGDYAAAQAAFESFLATYPASSFRPNAQYWLGEAHRGQLSFRTALVEFQKVVDDYPQSNKVADALLKIGYTNDELGNRDAARQALMRVLRDFPGTEIAEQASARLQRIAAETR